jgi:hypothetical protein
MFVTQKNAVVFIVVCVDAMDDKKNPLLARAARRIKETMYTHDLQVMVVCRPPWNQER